MLSNVIDDGFFAELVETANFDGIHEIPRIERPDKLVIPSGMVPFSHRNASTDRDKFVCFYERDLLFADCLSATKKYCNELTRFAGIVSPDYSLSVDMPITDHGVKIYMSRAVGAFFQSLGMYVIPNVRWGDERTYTPNALRERIAFLGLPKRSILSVGTYNYDKDKETKNNFRDGLEAMLEELEPEIVLVYGPMPENLFKGLNYRTRFVQYPAWTSNQKLGGC